MNTIPTNCTDAASIDLDVYARLVEKGMAPAAAKEAAAALAGCDVLEAEEEAPAHAAPGMPRVPGVEFGFARNGNRVSDHGGVIVTEVRGSFWLSPQGGPDPCNRWGREGLSRRAVKTTRPEWWPTDAEWDALAKWVAERDARLWV